MTARRKGNATVGAVAQGSKLKKQPKSMLLGSWAQYENEKSAWDAANPGASYSVRDAAMHSIARRLGV